MRAVDSVLLRFYSLIVAATSVWALLWLLGVPPVMAITEAATTEKWWFFGLIAVGFILSIRYLVFRLQPSDSHSFVKDTGSGEIRIGYPAVEEMARRAAKQVRGVERLQTQVSENAEGLVVVLRVRAEPHVDLTAMSEALQQTVTETIRSTASLTVAAVHVQVAGIAPDVSQRQR